MLHDIGRQKEFQGEIECHARWGGEKAEQILVKNGFSEEFSEKVGNCIRSHRYSNDISPSSTEAKILSDADNLDALGAVGVVRVFSFGGEENIKFRGQESSMSHIRSKILGLKDRMYTEPGRTLAEERTLFVKEFVDRFMSEYEGEK